MSAQYKQDIQVSTMSEEVCLSFMMGLFKSYPTNRIQSVNDAKKKRKEKVCKWCQKLIINNYMCASRFNFRCITIYDMHNVNPKFHATFADDINLTSIENLITQLILDEQTIEWVTELNFLGLTID